MGNLDYAPLGMKLSGYARLLQKRRFKVLSFWKVRLGGKEMQLLLEGDKLPNYSEMVRTPPGSCIYCEGVVIQTKTGDIAVRVEAIRIENTNTSAGLKTTDKQWYPWRGQNLVANSSTLGLLARLSAMVATIRCELAASGFEEFNTGVLQQSAEVGRAEVFRTKCYANNKHYSLTLTSEVKLKHLLVAGFDAVFEILQSFRNEGIDHLHSPEFTLLEMYRVNVTYIDMMNLVERLVTSALNAGLRRWPLSSEEGGNIDKMLEDPFERITFEDLCQDRLGLSPRECCLEKMIERFPSFFRPGMSIFTWVFKLINRVLAPTLLKPTFITELPSGISPFVKVTRGREEVSDRAALVISGLDIADIYTDENDPERLKQALTKQALETRREVNPAFLQLVEFGLPPSAGVGMGINRLALLLRGNLPLNIKNTMLFPIQ